MHNSHGKKIYIYNIPWNRLQTVRYRHLRSSFPLWRRKTNEKLENLINHENTVRHIKSKRLSWVGHVERMRDEREVKGIYEWKPHTTRLKGRPRLRWDDVVRDDLRKMGVNNWKQKAQEGKPWRGIIEQAKICKEL